MFITFYLKYFQYINVETTFDLVVAIQILGTQYVLPDSNQKSKFSFDLYLKILRSNKEFFKLGSAKYPKVRSG